MRSCKLLASAAAVAALWLPAAARADCKMLEIAEFHTDPASREPIVEGEVNGKPVKVLIDTGSTFSLIPRHEAERLGLVLTPIPGAHALGVGGQSDLMVTRLKELKIDKFEKDGMELQVAGDRYVPSEASIVLGDDFFSQVDAEFDLPDNAVRLLKPQGCAPDQLVYWGAAYSQAQLLTWERDAPKTQTEAFVNGKRVLAELDTGAFASAIDASFADSAGVERIGAGAAIHGEGASARDTSIGRFASFAFGDEKVNNVRLQVMDLTSDFSVPVTGSNLSERMPDTPLLMIGADFFRAHRVYIDVRDHLILFSYSGGPVFNPAAPTMPGKPAS